MLFRWIQPGVARNTRYLNWASSPRYNKTSLPVRTTGCLATWCPCILYGKTLARRDGNPGASFCNGSVRIHFIHIINRTLLTPPTVSVWAVAPSHFALFRVSARCSPAAARAASMVSREMAVATAWLPFSVVAARWCKKIKKWKRTKREIRTMLLRSGNYRWCMLNRSSNMYRSLESTRKQKSTSGRCIAGTSDGDASIFNASPFSSIMKPRQFRPKLWFQVTNIEHFFVSLPTKLQNFDRSYMLWRIISLSETVIGQSDIEFSSSIKCHEVVRMGSKLPCFSFHLKFQSKARG